MEPFPFFRRPYYYYDQSRYINHYNAQNRANERRAEQEKRECQNQPYSKETISKPRQPYNNNQSQVIPRISAQTLMEDDFFLEIFGIKLYFDDILIIALIFFLYNEGVRDNFLFISLILLLLS